MQPPFSKGCVKWEVESENIDGDGTFIMNNCPCEGLLTVYTVLDLFLIHVVDVNLNLSAFEMRFRGAIGDSTLMHEQ